MAKNPPEQNLRPLFWRQLSLFALTEPKLPNRQLMYTVDQSQLSLMASETVDPIDWPFRVSNKSTWVG